MRIFRYRMEQKGWGLSVRPGFSWPEEVAAKREMAVPFNLEEELKKRGAKYSKAEKPFAPYVREDGRLITGQNPGSARAVGEAVVAKLNAN